MRFPFRIALALLPLLAGPAARADSLVPIVIPPGDGLDLSGLGDHGNIWDVFRAGDGHLVLYVSFRDKTGVYRSDYYDTASKKLLLPDQEIDMANSPGEALGKKLRPPDLVEVPTHIGKLEGHERGVEQDYEGGSLCRFVYSNPWSVWDSSKGEQRFVLLHRLEKPQTWSSVCESGHPFQVHYQELGAQLFGADDKGFFAVLGVALIRFDWQGHSRFFKAHRDYVQVPYERLLAFQEANGRGDPDVQANKMHEARERYIDSLRGQ